MSGWGSATCPHILVCCCGHASARPPNRCSQRPPRERYNKRSQRIRFDCATVFEKPHAAVATSAPQAPALPNVIVVMCPCTLFHPFFIHPLFCLPQWLVFAALPIL